MRWRSSWTLLLVFAAAAARTLAFSASSAALQLPKRTTQATMRQSHRRSGWIRSGLSLADRPEEIPALVNTSPKHHSTRIILWLLLATVILVGSGPSELSLSHTIESIAIATAHLVGSQYAAFVSLLSGGVGGLCAVFVGHPLDLVKIKLQTASLRSVACKQPQLSVRSILARTLKEEGVRGLYRGVTAPLWAVTPLFAINFWGFDWGRGMVDYISLFMSLPPIFTLCLAGGLSALPTTLITAPSERIKCLMQLDNNTYSSLADCGRDLLRTGGLRSLFRGFGATLLRDVPGCMAYFGVYETLKQHAVHHSFIPPVIAILLAGGLAGIAAWVVCMPADVIKNRFQSNDNYRNLSDVYRELLRREGPRALFCGVGPALTRAFPANAACFLGMELTRQLLL